MEAITTQIQLLDELLRVIDEKWQELIDDHGKRTHGMDVEKGNEIWLDQYEDTKEALKKSATIVAQRIWELKNNKIYSDNRTDNNRI